MGWIAEGSRARLAVQAIEHGLGIERFQVARPAGHKEKDNCLGASIGPSHECDLMASTLKLAPESCHGIQMPTQLRANQA